MRDLVIETSTYTDKTDRGRYPLITVGLKFADGTKRDGLRFTGHGHYDVAGVVGMIRSEFVTYGQDSACEIYDHYYERQRQEVPDDH